MLCRLGLCSTPICHLGGQQPALQQFSLQLPLPCSWAQLFSQAACSCAASFCWLPGACGGWGEGGSPGAPSPRPPPTPFPPGWPGLGGPAGGELQSNWHNSLHTAPNSDLVGPSCSLQPALQASKSGSPSGAFWEVLGGLKHAPSQAGQPQPAPACTPCTLWGVGWEASVALSPDWRGGSLGSQATSNPLTLHPASTPGRLWRAKCAGEAAPPSPPSQPWAGWPF